VQQTNCAKFHLDQPRGFGSVVTKILGVSIESEVILNTMLSATALSRDLLFSESFPPGKFRNKAINRNSEIRSKVCRRTDCFL
jgi:hypothetical protein